MTTASAATQLLYQLIKHPKEKRTVMRELEKALCSMGKAEREELDVEDQLMGIELTAS